MEQPPPKQVSEADLTKLRKEKKEKKKKRSGTKFTGHLTSAASIGKNAVFDGVSFLALPFRKFTQALTALTVDDEVPDPAKAYEPLVRPTEQTGLFRKGSVMSQEELDKELKKSRLGKHTGTVTVDDNLCFVLDALAKSHVVRLKGEPDETTLRKYTQIVFNLEPETIDKHTSDHKYKQDTHLRVRVISGEKLKAKDSDGLSDPFCVVELVSSGENPNLHSSVRNNPAAKFTKTIENSLNPQWNENLDFLKVTNLQSQFLNITCWDNDSEDYDEEASFRGIKSSISHAFKKDQGYDFLGWAQQSLAKIPVGGAVVELELQKRSHRSHISGKIKLEISVFVEGHLEAHQATKDSVVIYQRALTKIAAFESNRLQTLNGDWDGVVSDTGYWALYKVGIRTGVGANVRRVLHWCELAKFVYTDPTLQHVSQSKQQAFGSRSPSHEAPPIRKCHEGLKRVFEEFSNLRVLFNQFDKAHVVHPLVESVCASLTGYVLKQFENFSNVVSVDPLDLSYLDLCLALLHVLYAHTDPKKSLAGDVKKILSAHLQNRAASVLRETKREQGSELYYGKELVAVVRLYKALHKEVHDAAALQTIFTKHKMDVNLVVLMLQYYEPFLIMQTRAILKLWQERREAALKVDPEGEHDTLIFTLYVKVQSFNTLRAGVCSEDDLPSTPIAHEFEWHIIQWILISGQKGSKWVDSVVQKDKATVVSERVLHSSSVIITFRMIDEMWNFFVSLKVQEWILPSMALSLTGLALHTIIFNLLMQFALATKRKLFDEGNFDTNGRFDVSDELCVTLNNLNDIITNIRILEVQVSAFLQAIVDNHLLRVKMSKPIYETTSFTEDNTYAVVSQSNLSVFNDQILTKFDAFTEHFTSLADEIKRLQTVMICNVTVPIEKEIYTFLNQALKTVEVDFLSGALLAAEPLLDYLEENLQTAHQRMYDEVMAEFLPQVYNTVLKCIKSLFLPRSSRDIMITTSHQHVFIPRLIDEIYEYFSAGGAGLSSELLLTPEYSKISDLSLLARSDVGFLIASYYRRLAVCRPVEVGKLGSLRLATTVTIPYNYENDRKYNVKIEVISGSNLIGVNNHGTMSDPYVTIEVFPPRVSTNVKDVKTNHVNRNKVDPQWNYIADYQLEGNPCDDVVLVFSVLDYERVHRPNPMGEVAVILKSDSGRVEQDYPVTASIPDVEINRETNEIGLVGPSVSAKEVYALLEQCKVDKKQDPDSYKILSRFLATTKHCYEDFEDLPRSKWDSGQVAVVTSFD
eukprot:m.129636 g.129636  ORF g.129636 m.129636 type:complete len:1259 (+) comp29413_c0_seq1:86-3862(+)